MLYPQLVTCSRIQSFQHLVVRFCGGLGVLEEANRERPTDQDAVEAVSRQRDCVTQAAADSEILLLPFHSKFGSSLHSSTHRR